MSHPIPAIYDSGVFRPLEPVDWPEGSRAEVVLLPQATMTPSKSNGSWPACYFDQTAGALANETFDRPAQGDLPRRDDW
jgi:hypothetical protein